MNDLDLSRAVWRKSSHSSANGQCVEVAHLDSAVAIRDSKNPDAGTLLFSPAEWKVFLGGIRQSQSG